MRPHGGEHTAGNAIFHTDHGSQYTSRQFRESLAESDIRQSTGRTGSCFDNAAAESFFAVLKSEIGTTAWQTRAQACFRPTSSSTATTPEINIR
ncbi:DDE-type integrase/transposase/recombinase [Streptomyces sp. NPDC001544]|uniref:DDE-type integrase/transposase/recombinase n=1 Tax=Streptomyces sp. NPDC001544 TaxID=3364584 RepID=UPI003699C03A